jgi:hypothetical protein
MSLGEVLSTGGHPIHRNLSRAVRARIWKRLRSPGQGNVSGTVLARQATKAGGINSLEPNPGLPDRLQIWALERGVGHVVFVPPIFKGDMFMYTLN